MKKIRGKFRPPSNYTSPIDPKIAEHVVDECCRVFPDRYSNDEAGERFQELHAWIYFLARDDRTDAHLIRRICTLYLDEADTLEFDNYEDTYWAASDIALCAFGHPHCPPEILARACRSKNLYYAECAAEKDRTPVEDKVYVTLYFANVDKSLR